MRILEYDEHHVKYFYGEESVPLAGRRWHYTKNVQRRLRCGEMSEWLKEHAWKSTLPARADAHEIPPTQFRINNFRNIDARRSLAVNDALRQGLRGDLTQF